MDTRSSGGARLRAAARSADAEERVCAIMSGLLEAQHQLAADDGTHGLLRYEAMAAYCRAIADSYKVSVETVLSWLSDEPMTNKPHMIKMYARQHFRDYQRLWFQKNAAEVLKYCAAPVLSNAEVLVLPSGSVSLYCNVLRPNANEQLRTLYSRVEIRSAVSGKAHVAVTRRLLSRARRLSGTRNDAAPDWRSGKTPAATRRNERQQSTGWQRFRRRVMAMTQWRTLKEATAPICAHLARERAIPHIKMPALRYRVTQLKTASLHPKLVSSLWRVLEQLPAI